MVNDYSGVLNNSAYLILIAYLQKFQNKIIVPTLIIVIFQLIPLNLAVHVFKTFYDTHTKMQVYQVTRADLHAIIPANK